MTPEPMILPSLALPLAAMLPWFVLWPFFAAARAIDERYPRRALAICQFVASHTVGATSAGGQRLNAAAQVDEATIWGRLGDQGRSLAINDGVIRAYGRSLDNKLRQHVAWATVNKGWDLIESDRSLEAIEVYESLSERLPRDMPFLEPLAQGLMNWAAALDKLGRHSEEKEVYGRIQDLLAGTQDDSTSRHLAWAFLNKGITLDSERDFEAAIAMYDVVLRRWWTPSVSADTPTRMHEAMAAALRHRSAALADSGHPEAAIADADRAVNRYLGAGDKGIEEEVAWALLTKGVALEALGRKSEARLTYDALVNRYRRSSGEQVRIAVGSARRLREGLENSS
jgi:tetratricopeptide (TPR) repeat protein